MNPAEAKKTFEEVIATLTRIQRELSDITGQNSKEFLKRLAKEVDNAHKKVKEAKGIFDKHDKYRELLDDACKHLQETYDNFHAWMTSKEAFEPDKREYHKQLLVAERTHLGTILGVLARAKDRAEEMSRTQR